MSERKISVSLTFDFYPDGEHDFLFEEMTEDEIIKSALGMAVEDAQRAEARMFDVVVTSE